MTEYQRGYLDGYRDVRGAADVGGQEAERVTLAEMVEGVRPDPAGESDYWLGYYHGRGHARRGQAGPGALCRAEVPPGL